MSSENKDKEKEKVDETVPKEKVGKHISEFEDEPLHLILAGGFFWYFLETGNALPVSIVIM